MTEVITQRILLDLLGEEAQRMDRGAVAVRRLSTRAVRSSGDPLGEEEP